MDAKDQLIDDLKKRVRDLMNERDALVNQVNTLEAAANISHHAYEALLADNDLLRHELAQTQAYLATERQRRDKPEPDAQLDLLADALRPFAESGRHIPANARPKTFYVPGVRNATSFGLNDLRLAAEVWEVVFGWEK